MIIEIRNQLYKIEFAYWDRSVRATINLMENTTDPDHSDSEILLFTEVAGGIAKCSEKDQINWKVGRKKALLRALDQLDWTHEERTDFWTQLFDPEFGIKRE